MSKREPPCGRVDPVPGVAGTRGYPGQRGFSLLEVLVAFAILSLTLGVLMQIFSRALTTTALSGVYSRASTLAEAQLNAVGLDIPLAPGTHTGDSEDGLIWQVTIDPHEFEEVTFEAPVEPYLVTSVVSWETAEGTRRVTLATLRLGEAP